jgi:chemotaxis protein methyltransferase CheR
MISLTESEFKQLTGFVQNNYGINLTEKKGLVEGRLQNVLIEQGFNNFDDYFHYVLSDDTGEAITTFINKLTTNHTYFLREVEHFKYFRDKVLLYLVSVLTGRDLRIWSAGCSTGEEPYILAMIMVDYFGFQKHLWDSKILATDISQKALDIAAKGSFTEEQTTAIPFPWKRSYFKKNADGKYIVTDQIKDQVIFRRYNLVTPVFPFKKKFHVIFCKNVMIYFNLQTKQELVNRLYEITEPGGYLFIGLSESLNCDLTQYKYLLPGIYRKE